MIDLHSHLLPGIDDGAPDLNVSLDMARAAVANGVGVMACTPHIFPGVWPNTGPDIRQRVAALQNALDEHGIALNLITGADVHITPDLANGLRSGHLLSLADTRYVLLETPHTVAPPHLNQCFFGVQAAGYVPIFTHPERLTWIESHYSAIQRLAECGVWMQITAGSLLGSFGRRARYWAEKMLDDGIVHILASDAHDMQHRPPVLAEGHAAAAAIVGPEEAYNLVVARPYGILYNQLPSQLPPLPNAAPSSEEQILGDPMLGDQILGDQNGNGTERASYASEPAGEGVDPYADHGNRPLARRVRKLFGWS